MLEGELMGRSIPSQSEDLRSLAEVEAEHIARVMSATGGDRSRAANVLGITPAALGKKLKQAGESSE